MLDCLVRAVSGRPVFAWKAAPLSSHVMASSPHVQVVETVVSRINLVDLAGSERHHLCSHRGGDA